MKLADKRLAILERSVAVALDQIEHGETDLETIARYLRSGVDKVRAIERETVAGRIRQRWDDAKGAA